MSTSTPISTNKTMDLSVVIPSVNGWSDLEGAVEALANQKGDHAIEILVVDRLGEGVRSPLRERFPQVRILETPPRTTIPEMRRMAFEVARGQVVGVIEDHVRVPADWANQMLSLQAAGEEIVGGRVENAADQRFIDRAAFLCEYAACLAPPDGPSEWLTGNNVTYQRGLLDRFAAVIAEDGWENRLHDAIRDSGVTLHSHPEISVGHKKHYTFWEYFSQRYLYARSYAAMRAEGKSLPMRLALGGAAFALPPLLLWRTIQSVRSSGQLQGDLLKSLPLLVLFVSSWAFGEVIGAWFGDGGALARVC
ncbi:MAG: glycosyltransferase [Deltaproteobacteria bacterium]|nr:glycosyltransferase [Deltaproteobacteria bacterium]MBW2396902.1 glycosyltransferase [Deltaproteobacteria bacterium]